ncbi:MAG: N-formylglutamate deformylase [Burkholderiales bacterium]|nr:N-formylglutamate deformylase [Burkholderiales bacterium]
MSFSLRRGTAPLLVSMPHIGTEIPEDLRSQYIERALAVEDADWHLERLYGFADELGATVLQPRYSRYVIDLNRPPDDAAMYPGASNTELCPTRFFTGDALYVQGCEPGEAERGRRRELYWQPYHTALAAELQGLKDKHGFVVLWDAHSIRSQIPWLFEGVLPDLNIGTAGGTSAALQVEEAVTREAAAQEEASHIVNGRFKGGYITRHYGRPAERVHAVQLEMVQKLYMRESPPYDYDERRAADIQPLLKAMLVAAVLAARKLHGA